MSDDGDEIPIRGFRPTDARACRALWVELTERHREIYGNPRIGGDDPGRQFDEHFERVGPDNLWVADRGGTAVGLTGLIVEENGVGEIEPVVVSASLRGRGIGRRLLERVVATAIERGLRRVCVRPVARNERALRFFHDRGLDVLGHLELMMDLKGTDPVWKTGPRLADRDFRF